MAKRPTPYQRRQKKADAGNAFIHEARHQMANALRCARESKDEWAEGVIEAARDALGHAFIQARRK